MQDGVGRVSGGRGSALDKVGGASGGAGRAVRSGQGARTPRSEERARGLGAACHASDRALWNLTKASRQSDPSTRLEEIHVPSLVITGDDDRIVPTEQSVRLGREIPDAEPVVIPDCGHVPHEECPGPVLDAVSAFLARLGD